MGPDGYGPFEDLSDANMYISGLQGHFLMNVEQYSRTVHASLPYLKKSKDASFLSISSVAATGCKWAMVLCIAIIHTLSMSF